MNRKYQNLCLAIGFALISLTIPFEPVTVFASSEPVHEILVNIDETIGSLSGLFDDISRFNHFGLAIISKNVDPSQTVVQNSKKYGIINLNGEIVIDTVYDEILDFGEDYWTVSKWVKDDRGAFYVLRGLVSKQSGAMILPDVYAEIPDIQSVKYALLLRPTLKTVDGQSIYVEKKELKSISSGSIRNAVLPTGIDLEAYEAVYEVAYGTYHLMTGRMLRQVNGQSSWKTDTWVIDDQGDAALDFTFDRVNGVYTRDNDTTFIAYESLNPNNHFITTKAGLLKLTRVDGKVTVTKLMSDMTKYNGIRLVSNEKRVYYYDAKGLLWYLDLQDETTHQKIDQPQDIDMNVNCGWFASESEPSKRVYKCGLKKPDGTVVLDQVYDSIYYVTSGYYAIGTREGDELFYRLANSNGEILISKKYLSIGYNEALDWILLTGYWPIKDRNNPGTTFNFNAVTSYYDLKSGKLIAEAVELNLEMLATVGYSLAQAYTGEGYSRMVNSYDEFGHFLSRDMEYVGDTLQGVFSREGVYLLEPKYIMLNPLFDQYEATMKFEGYFQFDLVESTHTCGSRYFDGNTKKMAEETYTCQIIRKGIFSVKDGIVLEPKYTNILFSGQDIIQAEYTNFVRNEATQYVEELGRNESFYYAGPSPMPKYGLISVTQGELIPALYEGFSSTNESSPNPTASIEFNKYGFMKIYKSNWDGVHDETFFNLVGLINRNGIVIEPIYKVLYIRNGYIYMQDKEGSWTIKNASDLTQTITIDKSLAESINYDSVQIVGDYIVVERKVVDDLERYSLYGIYNKDLSVFLPIEYTSVTFDGTYWYLEKYDDVNGVYPRAIMDTDKHYIVAFSSQYDYLSEFVGGYAVGQSGTYTATTSSAVPSKKYAAKKDAPFVLNLINVDGIVVSDLSDQYESITLLGQTDSVSRALVKKNGIYYFANLVEGPRIIKVPSKFNVSAWMIGGISMVGLGLGLYWMTKKKGLRLFHKKA